MFVCRLDRVGQDLPNCFENTQCTIFVLHANQSTIVCIHIESNANRDETGIDSYCVVGIHIQTYIIPMKRKRESIFNKKWIYAKDLMNGPRSSVREFKSSTRPRCFLKNIKVFSFKSYFFFCDNFFFFVHPHHSLANSLLRPQHKQDDRLNINLDK